MIARRLRARPSKRSGKSSDRKTRGGGASCDVAIPVAPVASKGPPPLPAAVSAAPAHNPFLPLSPSPPPPSAESPSFAAPIAVAKPAAPAPFTAFRQVSAPRAVAPQMTATSQLAPPPRVFLSDDLPDLFDGRARNRRAIMVVIGMALLVLLGAVATAIASHYRPV
jgi:hypothetical protein